MEQQTFIINGMGGKHCEMVITNLIARLDGVQLDAIETGKATVTIDPEKSTAQTVVAAIEKAGYKVQQ